MDTGKALHAVILVGVVGGPGGRGVNPLPEGCVAVRYKVEFTRGHKGQKRLRTPTPPPERRPIDPVTVPQITRMLVLGYHFERLVREGKVKNYSEIAKLTGLSRARVTQLVDLTLLPPGMQNEILCNLRGVSQDLRTSERACRARPLPSDLLNKNGGTVKRILAVAQSIVTSAEDRTARTHRETASRTSPAQNQIGRS